MTCWTLTKIQNLPFQSCSCILAAHRTGRLPLHRTAVVNMITFIVTFILFSTFSVPSWQPCWCWWWDDVVHWDKTTWYFTLITTNGNFLGNKHHMCSSRHNSRLRNILLALHAKFFHNEVPRHPPADPADCMDLKLASLGLLNSYIV